MKNNQPNPKNSTCVEFNGNCLEEAEKEKSTLSLFQLGSAELQKLHLFYLSFTTGLSKL